MGEKGPTIIDLFFAFFFGATAALSYMGGIDPHYLPVAVISAGGCFLIYMRGRHV